MMVQGTDQMLDYVGFVQGTHILKGVTVISHEGLGPGPVNVLPQFVTVS